ncbi:P-loop containing nucleoside triphosphate hydrolase protein [Dactylonectria macrodidyma]|uniref:P-loop containing nucleoside triphosphate hydrolase protein n=1 Tax=Dactylonectria macrodidyma TaxID=307937 RepID=A0A9P9FUG7_9HYPO|nr:P-loop containing nucleoside triphosphate hydrolase protein [Dactylonectria macrodidyma]
MVAEADSIGSKCEIMTFYNHSSDPCDRFPKWSEFEDLVAEERRIRELGKAFAVIHRRSKVEREFGETWMTHSIEAQSPRLQKLLDVVFQDYPSWYPDATPYAVGPPFKPYVHRWNKILELGEGLDEKIADEVQLLRGALEPLISSHLADLSRARAKGTISFESLWLILSPGCLMVSCEKGYTCLSKLVTVEFVQGQKPGDSCWILKSLRVNWNGSHCGLERQVAIIPKFVDSIQVTKLTTYPLEFAPDREHIEAKLLARGRKFEALRGLHVKTCQGKKYTREYNPVQHRYDEAEKPISGRIIVDAYAHYKVQEQVPPARSKKREDKSKSVGRSEDLSPLTDLECLLAVPRVKGLDLSTKEWSEFNVDEIDEVEWNLSPYNNLVLPEGEKELIMAFTDRDPADADHFDDFMAHKGEGIIILLCGPPGVGKTLTAEAVAEKSRVPLYIMSAGDLGTDAAKVESHLLQALECCQLWNAVLLIDEADVFLETRDSNSLDRNELVSIFLRRLEYYRGLMFLTTNRFNAIDPAFKSRLDLILPYSDLDESSRRKVWVNFIQKLGPGVASISEEDYDQLAKTELNGREIKNSIKMALVLAKRDKPLRLKHLTTVVNIHTRVETLV